MAAILSGLVSYKPPKCMWRLFLYTTNKYDDDNNKGHDKV